MCPENIVVMVMNKTYFLPLQNMVVNREKLNSQGISRNKSSSRICIDIYVQWCTSNVSLLVIMKKVSTEHACVCAQSVMSESLWPHELGLNPHLLHLLHWQGDSLPLSHLSFPGGSGTKDSACNGRRPRLYPGLGRSLGEGKWQPTPVFLPGKSQGQRSLECYSP